jgi:hypothetical protein
VRHALELDEPTPDELARLLSRCDLRAAGGHWLWTGASSHGYGYVWWRSHAVRVHRLTFRGLVGPIAAGLVVDHRCSTKLCANPVHLRACGQDSNVAAAWLRGEIRRDLTPEQAAYYDALPDVELRELASV